MTTTIPSKPAKAETTANLTFTAKMDSWLLFSCCFGIYIPCASVVTGPRISLKVRLEQEYKFVHSN